MDRKKNLKTLAWVIGINKYDNYPELHAAVNDAKAIAEKLEILGYDVIRSIGGEDNYKGTYDEILASQQTFIDKIFKGVDVALLYFSGHGCMINMSDCLLLKDTAAYVNQSVSAKGKSIIVSDLCKEMNANGNQINLLIIDACRVNADNRGSKFSGFGTNTTLPFQSYFAFSTSPEAAASDGSIHSVYTQLLLQKMMTENLEIEKLFKSIRSDMRHAGNHQISCEQTSLVDSYCFNYGQLNNGAALPYSQAALEDASFVSPNMDFTQCLSLFKSYNYYKQNDAVKLFHAKYKNLSDEEQFVIGRNILQSACGDSIECDKELTYSRMKLYQNGDNNPVLEGVLYEMYFDSKNMFRGKLHIKGIRFLSKIHILSAFKEFENSFKSITKVLASYREELYYVPGEQKHFSVKVDIHNDGPDMLGNNIWVIDSIVCDTDDLSSLISFDYQIHPNSMRERISQAIAAPLSCLNVDYSNKVEEQDWLILNHPKL